MPLPRSISANNAAGRPVEVQLAAGEPVFILGANGTGKSALLVKMAHILADEGLRLVAGRQVFVEQDSPEITASQANSLRSNSKSWDSSLGYRARPPNMQGRAQLYVYSLLELENAFSREISSRIRATQADDLPALQALRSPLEIINSALTASGFPVAVSITPDARVEASKSGGEPYGVSQMSDGERAALFMLVEAMATPQGSTILIDEPERHVHRSLLLPLIREMVQIRNDCCFIIATHDPELPVAYPESQVLLVRGMSVFGECWDMDLVTAAAIPVSIRESILGSRRRILFVEGDENGLDHGLYNLIFGNMSVVARGNSRSVEQATAGARSLSDLSWLHAWGIIDRDGRSDEELRSLGERGIWALPVYSVESLYYHPVVVARMAEKAAVLHALDGSAVPAATKAALEAVREHLDRLAGRAVEKTVRRTSLAALPGWKQFPSTTTLTIPVNPKEMWESELRQLSSALDEGNWEYVLARCPIRETGAPKKIASALGFKDAAQYESSVRTSLAEDAQFRNGMLGLLGEPPSGLVEN